jgi:hypothetical protein
MWSIGRPGMLPGGKCLQGSIPSEIPRLALSWMLLKNVMAGVSPPIVRSSGRWVKSAGWQTGRGPL